MTRPINLSGVYVEPSATNAVKQLAQLNNQWLTANAEREAAWSLFCGSSYDPRMVDRYNATTDLCTMFAQRIIRHKRTFGI